VAGLVYPNSLDHSHHLALSGAREDQAETKADDIVQIAVTNPTSSTLVQRSLSRLVPYTV